MKGLKYPNRWWIVVRPKAKWSYSTITLGNILSNIHKDDLPEIKDYSKVVVHIGDQVINGLNRTFGERPPGTLICLFDSTGLLMISVVNGKAIDLIHPNTGDPVTMKFE